VLAFGSWNLNPGQKSGDWHQETIEVNTIGRETRELTGLIDQIVARSDVQTGLCHIFLQHTSASLLLSENTDPVVQVDLEHLMQRIIRDGDPVYRHANEGPDDMSAHLRSVLTGSFLTLPVVEILAGTWCMAGRISLEASISRSQTVPSLDYPG